MSVDDERAMIEKGWDYLKLYPEDSAFFDRWLDRLALYTDTPVNTDILPEPSPWIEELREQLTLGGLADVEPRKETRRVKD